MRASLFYTIVLPACISCTSVDTGKVRKEWNNENDNTAPHGSLRRQLQSTVVPQFAPTTSPLPTFINSTGSCPLRIANSRCADLIDSSTQILEPVAGCDCYNFCGEEYSGCCSRTEDCSIQCNIDVDPVAGCRLDGVVDPVEYACAATLQNGTKLEFEEGDPYGSLVTTQCGPSDEFPCFCNTLSEDDGIRCPYCVFTTDSGEEICARDGESVSFVGVGGIQQTCNCTYLGNNQGATICEPIDEPPPQECVLNGNTNKCAEVTEYVSPIDDCDCYNFCQGELIGCCKYGEKCSADCSTGQNFDDLVTGCEIDPNKPPVTVPPIAPSNAPVEAPVVCLIRQNIDRCPGLIANQTPVEGCDCYNFCGNEYAGCCGADDFSCSANCIGLNPDEVLTTGCQFLPDEPDECKEWSMPCSEYSECCSNRCLFGSCQTPAPTVDSRQKLSVGHGGAAGRAKATGPTIRRLMKAKIRGL